MKMSARSASCWSRRRRSQVRARRRARQRKGRLRQIDDRDACRGRAAEGRPEGRHHRSRFPPEEFHPLHPEPPRCGRGAIGLQLEVPLHCCIARGTACRSTRTRRASSAIRRGHQRDRARPRFRRHRYAGQRHLSDAARAFDGRHADHAAQRQFRRLRRARHRRSADLRRHRHKPLLRDGARARRQRRMVDGRDRLDRGAKPSVDARLAQQAAGRRGLARTWRCGSASAPSTALPSAWSTANSSRAA